MLPNIKLCRIRFLQLFPVLKNIIAVPVKIRNTPAYRVIQEKAQMKADSNSHFNVFCAWYLEMLLINKRIRIRKAVSDQSIEYTSTRAGLIKMLKRKMRLYHLDGFEKPFIMPAQQ